MSKSLGKTLRGLRENKNLLLRQVAAALNMDTALLSKIERDERKPNKEQVIEFAKFYTVNQDDLLVIWLSDKVVNDLGSGHLAIEALKVAEARIKNKNQKK